MEGIGGLGHNGLQPRFPEQHGSQEAGFQGPDGHDPYIEIPDAQAVHGLFVDHIADHCMGQFVRHVFHYIFIVVDAQDLMAQGRQGLCHTAAEAAQPPDDKLPFVFHDDS